MARRELKAIPVMVHLEASLHSILQDIIQEDDDTQSTFFRELLIKEADRRGLLTVEQRSRLMGAAA